MGHLPNPTSLKFSKTRNASLGKVRKWFAETYPQKYLYLRNILPIIINVLKEKDFLQSLKDFVIPNVPVGRGTITYHITKDFKDDWDRFVAEFSHVKIKIDGENLLLTHDPNFEYEHNLITDQYVGIFLSLFQSFVKNADPRELDDVLRQSINLYSTEMINN